MNLRYLCRICFCFLCRILGIFLKHVKFTELKLLLSTKSTLETQFTIVGVPSMVFILMLKALHRYHKLLAKRDVENHEKPD